MLLLKPVKIAFYDVVCQSAHCGKEHRLSSDPLPTSAALVHPNLLSLWKQRASIAVQSESGATQRAAEESEQDMEILRTERKRRHSRVKEVGRVFLEERRRARRGRHE